MDPDTPIQAFRASILYFTADPVIAPEATFYLEDGLLLVRNGLVLDVLPASAWTPEQFRQHSVIDYRGYLLMPGFVDTHIHYPQMEIMASYGEQLLEWLDKYTFPAERRFADATYAVNRAEFFVQQLLTHGTTTAMVFGTVHPQSVEALFQTALTYNMRLIAGKIMMDRHAPADLCDTPESGYQQSAALIERWHGRGRLSYAVTPRFAPTSTPAQLQMAARLYQEYPGVYLQTHLSENQQEVDWVRSLFPDSLNYLDVYDSFGLLGDHSVFAHAIHLDEQEVQRLASSLSAVSFCPTANLFLGSGLFRLDDLKLAGVAVGMGTDIGAGTSFSLLQTLQEAYKVQQLRGQRFSAREAFYQATLGGARALQLDQSIGSFHAGAEADFIVLDWAATPLQQLRQQQSQTLDERLFALMMMGDDRNIRATYLQGQCAYQKNMSTEPLESRLESL